MTEIISITQEDIDKKIDNRFNQCPIAAALSTKYPEPKTKWLVLPDTVHRSRGKKWAKYNVSIGFFQWVAKFDGWRLSKKSERNTFTKPQPIDIEVNHKNKTMKLKGEEV